MPHELKTGKQEQVEQGQATTRRGLPGAATGFAMTRKGFGPFFVSIKAANTQEVNILTTKLTNLELLPSVS